MLATDYLALSGCTFLVSFLWSLATAWHLRAPFFLLCSLASGVGVWCVLRELAAIS